MMTGPPVPRTPPVVMVRPLLAAAVLAGAAPAPSAPAQDGPFLPGLEAPDPNAPPADRADPPNASPTGPAAPLTAPPTGPARAREGGVDARQYAPVPAEDPRTGRDSRDDRSDLRAPPPAANGYQYQAPSAAPPSFGAPSFGAPRFGAPQLGGSQPGSQNGPRLAPGYGAPGGGFDPDRSPVLLGISGQDTAAGVLVTRVVRGTPAEAAGLEVGDRVLTVGGYQVGFVQTPEGSRVFPLGAELARRLGPTGEAALLVQDGRSGRITTVNVRPVPRYPNASPYDPSRPTLGPAPPSYGPSPYGPGSDGGYGGGYDVQYRGAEPRR